MKKRTTQLLIAILALFSISSQSYALQPIKGSVTYHENSTKPIPYVQLGLYHVGSTEAIAITNTNPNGKYIFNNIPFGVYEIRAINTTTKPGGLEMNDRLLLDSIVRGIYNNPSEIQRLAADVNNDGNIDTTDLVVWDANWATTSFTPDWVFEDLIVSHTGTKANEVPPMGGSSSGDVNGTFVPTTRTEQMVEVSYQKQHFTPDFNIKIYANDLTSASAMGLVINYPSGVDIKNVTSQFSEITNLKITADQIIVTCINNLPISINSSEPVVVISGTINNQYDGNDIKFEIDSKSHFNLNGTNLYPSYSIPYLSVSGEYLNNSFPNPASENTSISFNLPCDSKTSLNLYNQTGQLVKVLINEDMAAGLFTFNLPVQELKSGVYFYTLNTTGITNINQSKRLIVIH